MQTLEMGAFEFVHRGLGLLTVVVVAENVEDSVHQEQGNLVVEGSSV